MKLASKQMVQHAHPILRLSSQRAVLWLGVAALIAILIQFLLGVSPPIIMLAIMVVTMGLMSFTAFGAYNIGSWLALFYVLGNVLIALYAKTLMDQALDSHLFAPLDSFLVLTVTTSALFVALIIERQMNVGGPLLPPTDKPKTLAWLSWGSFVLGVGFWFANQHFSHDT